MREPWSLPKALGYGLILIANTYVRTPAAPCAHLRLTLQTRVPGVMPKFCGFSNTYLMHAVTGGGSLRVTTSSSVTAAKNTKLQSLTHSLQTSTMRIFTSDIFTRCSCLSVNLTYSVCTADCQVRKTWMLKSRNSACVEGHSQCESHTRARSCCCLHASTCSQVVTLTQALGRFGNNHDCPYQTCSSPDLQRDDVMDLQSAGTGSCFVAFSRKISTSNRHHFRTHPFNDLY